MWMEYLGFRSESLCSGSAETKAVIRGVSIFWWSSPVDSLMLGPQALKRGEILP